MGIDNKPYVQLGTIGRLNVAKGYDHLIIALGEIKKDFKFSFENCRRGTI